MLKLLSYWPPYLASGISIKEVDPQIRRITVQMKLRFFNTNYVGSHYGGSLYSMCDPFYMFILIHHLGKDHIVWDQAAEVEFLRPARGTIMATFEISEEEINNIKNQAMQKFNIRPVFFAEVKDASGEVVVRVKKTLYVRRKDAKKRFERSNEKISHN